MIGDSEYHICSHDWPVGEREDDLTSEQVYRVLDQFDRFYVGSVRRLAETEIPRPGGAE